MTLPTGLSRAWIERLVESNLLGITVEQDRTIVEANDAFLGMLGYTREDLVAGRLRWPDLTPPEYADPDARALDDMLHHGGYAPLEKELLRKDGSRVAVLVGAAALSRAPLTSVAFVLDLTDRKALEARGRRAQRMESIIRLAGGIAHDFNNQLTAILGSAELLLENRTLDPEGRADVEQIRKAANRAARLARQLLAFSRRQASQPRVLDLNAVIEEMRMILRHLVGDRIEVVADLDAAGAPVLADLAQLEQAIVDAVLHARDRMPDGGRLTLATRSARVTGAEGPPGLAPGRYTALTVRDSGPPLGAAVADPLFEPRQSGAYAEVRNDPAGGAALTLYLPAVGPTAGESAPTPAADVPAGGETILLVEDEEQVRTLARRVLERAGFTVVEAGDAEAALQRANRHPGTIHLLVVDMMLPGLSGRELAAQLAIHRPAVKVLYISGTVDDAIGRHQVLAPGTEFLQKPFALDQLVRKVRKVLDSPSRP